ncbi:MAG TPA: hypothetical protein VMR37_01750, partial [Rhabdochlamydiaceae bacterium]|nr:hypothetical protein [Rhabdochlamydiaceae bacterium]
MRLSAVSGYASTAFLTLGRAVLPIAADACTAVALKRMTNPSFRTIIAVPSLAGLATLYGVSSGRRWSASNVLNVCVYGGCKLFQLISIYILLRILRKDKLEAAMKDAPRREERVPNEEYIARRDKRRDEERIKAIDYFNRLNPSSVSFHTVLEPDRKDPSLDGIFWTTEPAKFSKEELQEHIKQADLLDSCSTPELSVIIKEDHIALDCICVASLSSGSHQFLIEKNFVLIK